MVRALPSLAMVIGFTTLAGCSPPEPQTYPVEGVVKFEGKPPVGFMIEFSSDETDTKGISAVGTVEADGTYKLTTTLNGKDKDGAVAGKHKVVVVAPPVNRSPPVILPVPLKYQDYNTSGLTFEVKPGAENTIPINLSR